MYSQTNCITVVSHEFYNAISRCSLGFANQAVKRYPETICWLICFGSSCWWLLGFMGVCRTVLHLRQEVSHLSKLELNGDVFWKFTLAKPGWKSWCLSHVCWVKITPSSFGSPFIGSYGLTKLYEIRWWYSKGSCGSDWFNLDTYVPVKTKPAGHWPEDTPLNNARLTLYNLITLLWQRASCAVVAVLSKRRRCKSTAVFDAPECIGVMRALL